MAFWHFHCEVIHSQSLWKISQWLWKIYVWVSIFLTLHNKNVLRQNSLIQWSTLLVRIADSPTFNKYCNILPLESRGMLCTCVSLCVIIALQQWGNPSNLRTFSSPGKGYQPWSWPGSRPSGCTSSLDVPVGTQTSPEELSGHAENVNIENHSISQ